METFASIPNAIPATEFAFALGPNAIAEPLLADAPLPNAKELIADALELGPIATASLVSALESRPKEIELEPALAFKPCALPPALIAL